MRYVKFLLKNGKTIIFDKKTKHTLILHGDFDENLIIQYEQSCEVPKEIDSTITTFVLNLTDACNLRCRYCSRHKNNYLDDSMPEYTLYRTIERIIDYSKKINERCVIQFHGGEPTLRFESFRNVLLKIDKSLIQNHLDLRVQTNGTNISDEMINFFNEFNIHIGLSIDGPDFIMDNVRQFPNGDGITNQLTTNIKKIQNKLNRKSISCLCVITANSLGKAKDIFQFIRKNNIDDISMLPLYNDYSCINNDKSIIPRNSDMADFSKVVIDLWLDELKNHKEICIPNFQIWIWNLLANNTDTYLKCNSCCGVGETFVFIEKNGDIFPCGPLSDNNEMKMGNILKDDILLIKNINWYNDFINTLPRACQECGLQGVCKGGCKANSYLNYKDVKELDPYCDYWKAIIEHLLIRITDDPELIALIPDYTLRM